MSDKLTKLLGQYASNLQANFNGYYVAAAGGVLVRVPPPPPGSHRDHVGRGGGGGAQSEPRLDPKLSLWNAIAEATLWDHPPAPLAEHRVDNNNNTAIYGPTVTCSESCNCSTTAILVRDRPVSSAHPLNHSNLCNAWIPLPLPLGGHGTGLRSGPPSLAGRSC